MTSLEAARASGATLRQLQYWDEQGILTAKRIRRGYRRYRIEQVETARRLAAVSRSGFRLQLLRDVVTWPWKTVQVIAEPTLIGDVLLIPKGSIHRQGKAKD